jgi:hypothetical protein
VGKKYFFLISPTTAPDGAPAAPKSCRPIIAGMAIPSKIISCNILFKLILKKY